ncbi:LytR/AlgR family response regulator transcription factor [Propionicicella superfundia]|uniref:LytR/AlgR family response regulator transcription factor n=1 Tax=Propionicicella superfundia TaxID=348582 RepID=UPI000412477D|nr:LytTR family DNA-binding domain-containing protein [Propionicicella superfundia]
MISVLVVDDELPALDELEFLLRRDPRIGDIHRAASGAEAVRRLAQVRVDAAFLDIHMLGLSGLDLARTLAQFAHRPVLVFVTADDERAVEAFEVAAVDYLLKPVRAERLEVAISRVAAVLGAPAAPAAPVPGPTIAVTVGATTRMIRRDDVRYAQAQGDYTRLHTDEASYLVRMPISELEEQWHGAGYVRIHRSFLVALGAVRRARLAGPAPTVTVGAADLPVSRRMVPSVRAALERRRIRSSR